MCVVVMCVPVCVRADTIGCVRRKLFLKKEHLHKNTSIISSDAIYILMEMINGKALFRIFS